MDTSTLVAIIGFAGVIVTTVGGVLIAVVTFRSEKTSATTLGVEATQRERIALKDEQLADLRGDLQEKDQVIEDLEGSVATRDQTIHTLQTELADLQARLGQEWD